MLWLSRLLPAVSLIVSSVCLIGASRLADSDLSFLVQYLGQAGTLNPKILDKVRLIPTVLLITAAEALGISLVTLRYARIIQQGFEPAWKKLKMRQQAVVLLLVVHGLIGAQALNFGCVSLYRQLSVFGLNRQAQIAADFGEYESVFRAIKEQTPENARIAIRTQDPVKYLLNYELFSRRFFVYPDPTTALSEVPLEWFERHAIHWTLEINESKPGEFVLQPLHKKRMESPEAGP
jgi:hypothetical protein